MGLKIQFVYLAVCFYFLPSISQKFESFFHKLNTTWGYIEVISLIQNRVLRNKCFQMKMAN